MLTEQELMTNPENLDSELQSIPPKISDELSEVKQATQALVGALQGIVRAKIHSTSDLTEEAHQHIDQSVQILRDKADHGWQMAVHQLEDIDERMNKAAKAAWDVLTAPSPETNSDTNPDPDSNP
jgi:methyl-accepting chemotaxis protein